MKGIDRDLIRSYFDELQLATRLDEDGDMVLVQEADGDFGYDVVIFVMVNNNRLSYVAGAPSYEPAGNLLELCNKHNCRANMPTAVVRDAAVRMETTFLLDEEVSKEFIVENCIKMPLSAIWRGFCELEK